MKVHSYRVVGRRSLAFLDIREVFLIIRNPVN